MMFTSPRLHTLCTHTGSKSLIIWRKNLRRRHYGERWEVSGRWPAKRVLVSEDSEFAKFLDIFLSYSLRQLPNLDDYFGYIAEWVQTHPNVTRKKWFIHWKEKDTNSILFFIKNCFKSSLVSILCALYHLSLLLITHSYSQRNFQNTLSSFPSSFPYFFLSKNNLSFGRRSVQIRPFLL